MFDTVIIEGLKLKAPKEITNFLKENNAKLPSEFQTKDLDNVLSTFFINEKGEIFENKSKATGKKIPLNTPFLNWKDNRSFLERVYWNLKHKAFKNEESKLVDEFKQVKVRSKLTNTFTALSYDEINSRSLSLEYEFKAVEGKITKVKLISAELESLKDSQERKASDAEFNAKMQASFEARREFTSKWYYPIIKETYNPFIFFLRLLVQSACNSLIRWSYRWNGV